MHREFLWNGVELLQPDGYFRLGTDSIACAGFARFARGSKIADLGCGSGAIGLMLLASDPSLQVTGIELDPESAAMAAENGQRNQVQFTAIHGDLRQIRELLPAGSMDGCISNPPYFPVGSGQAAAGPMGRARSEETCTLAQLADAAAWLLRTGGKFVLVHRPERLADICAWGRTYNLEPKRLQLLRHRIGGPVSLLLVQCRKGGKPGLKWEELCLFEADGTPTPYYRKLYHL